MTAFTPNPQYMAKFLRAVEDGLTEAAGVAAARAETSFGSDHGGVPSQPGSPPNSQSGHLRNSIAYASPLRLGTPLHAAFGTNVPYGMYLEKGATVTAKRSKYLPVPINQPAKDMLRRQKGASLRTSSAKLVVEKARGGGLLLVEKTPRGKEKKNGAVFILKRSITIRPRPWALRAANDARTEMLAAFDLAVKRSLASP